MIVIVSLIYAKCIQGERLLLWESLEELAQGIQDPWLVGGDFNVITSYEEKLGELPVTIVETADFKH